MLEVAPRITADHLVAGALAGARQTAREDVPLKTKAPLESIPEVKPVNVNRAPLRLMVPPSRVGFSVVRGMEINGATSLMPEPRTQITTVTRHRSRHRIENWGNSRRRIDNIILLQQRALLFIGAVPPAHRAEAEAIRLELAAREAERVAEEEALPRVDLSEAFRPPFDVPANPADHVNEFA